MAQSSTVSGEHNTIVQIEGDGNTVLVDRRHLRLTRFEAHSTRPFKDIRLLQPTARVIPLVGREAEMAELLRFVADDAPHDIRVRVLVGDGGSGKTRLALELCERIKAHWNAGFVTTQELARFFHPQNAGDWGWQKPTLIVLDYAAAQAHVLAKWLRELQDRNSCAHPLRLLLLERHADPASGWHSTVFGWQHPQNRELLDPPEPQRIRPLVETADRMHILRSVLERVANELTAPLLDHPNLAHDLQDSPWAGDPLYLAMAALTMAQARGVSALRLGRTDLTREVAGHEQRRLNHLATSQGLAHELLEHLAACITLLQGLSREEAMAMVRAEKQATGFDTGDPAILLDLLHQALPGPEGQIAPIQPDLIGEAFLLNVWTQPERAEAVQRRFAADDSNHRPVLDTLVRLIQDFGAEHDRPSAWFENLMRRYWNDPPVLEQMDAAVPSVTVALSHINLQLAQRLAELDASAEPAQRAMRQNNLANRLSELGQAEAALAAAQEAMDLYRELARQRPDAYTPNLASSLNNLATVLSELGQAEAALAAAQEAMDLYRELVRQRPDAYTPNLATSLNNLAAMLSELGQAEAALAAAQEAVNLRREQARQRPDAYTPNLAMSLNNLALMLSELGQAEAALAAAQEAMDLYRELARQRPDAYTPNLATSLNNLATMLSELGQAEAALAAAQEAMDLYRELARQRPDAYTPDLAGSLNNLATMLSELGQAEAALAAAQEAMDLYRELARQRPDAYTPNLATSLNNLANRLGKLGQAEAALAAAQEAMDLYRELARQRPDAYTPNLARAQIVLALQLERSDGAAAAVPQAHEAIQTLSAAFMQRPQSHGGLMLAMLNDYLRLCQTAELEPDRHLLATLHPYLPPGVDR